MQNGTALIDLLIIGILTFPFSPFYDRRKRTSKEKERRRKMHDITRDILKVLPYKTRFIQEKSPSPPKK